ncbi:uncharacterized protein [Triticum aestivum]|uniref:uncharacterized protein n=1 Tax=Triticum aestivum TaxID=4565 RepID=UPI001D009D32|nr:uncharacterized protein LOC123136623 [Triticum aestivum]
MEMGKRRVRSDSAPSCSSERPCIGEFFCSSCSSLHPHVCCRGVSGRAASSSEVRAHRWPPTTFEMGHPFPSLSLPLRGDPEPDEPTESGRRQSHHGNPTNTRIYAVSTAMESLWAMQLGCLQLTFGVQFAGIGMRSGYARIAKIGPDGSADARHLSPLLLIAAVSD